MLDQKLEIRNIFLQGGPIAVYGTMIIDADEMREYIKKSCHLQYIANEMVTSILLANVDAMKPNSSKKFTKSTYVHLGSGKKMNGLNGYDLITGCTFTISGVINMNSNGVAQVNVNYRIDDYEKLYPDQFGLDAEADPVAKVLDGEPYKFQLMWDDDFIYKNHTIQDGWASIKWLSYNKNFMYDPNYAIVKPKNPSLLMQLLNAMRQLVM